jgi:hypothetical protein
MNLRTFEKLTTKPSLGVWITSLQVMKVTQCDRFRIERYWQMTEKVFRSDTWFSPYNKHDSWKLCSWWQRPHLAPGGLEQYPYCAESFERATDLNSLIDAVFENVKLSWWGQNKSTWVKAWVLSKLNSWGPDGSQSRAGARQNLLSLQSSQSCMVDSLELTVSDFVDGRAHESNSGVRLYEGAERLRRSFWDSQDLSIQNGLYCWYQYSNHHFAESVCQIMELSWLCHLLVSHG